MTRATSFFLDGLRLAAALVVFFAHTTHYWNPSLMGVMQVWAHDAVVVFFVLSGYVIAHSTREGARDAKRYTTARLSRLYSVVIPALVLTAILWIVGRELDPQLYANYERAFPWVRFVASALFVNEVWMFELSPPTNTPFWSLGYEAWYYAFFGVALFVRSGRWKWILLLIGAAAAGPNVLMLLPVWLVGVAAYAWRDIGRFSPVVAVVGFAAAVLCTSMILLRLPDWPTTPGSHPWYFAGAALSDLIGGIGWAAVIWFFNRAFSGLRIADAIYRPARWVAGHTFSLYLYHAPLVIMATALAPPFMVKGLEWAPMAAIIVVVIVLGALTESQRQHWQRGLEWIWDRATADKRAK
jgi:peptidoglycan/LPS O-acetylase OafA/YrhL